MPFPFRKLFSHLVRGSRDQASTAHRSTVRLTVEQLEDRVTPSATSTVLTVENTNDSGIGSLRQAILDANASPGPDVIQFDLNDADGRHYYYKDDGVANQVTLANIMQTSTTDDSQIPTTGPNAIDPDWLHSWWSIALNSSLPPITDAVFIDGYSQTGALPNSLAGGIDSILRVELTGTGTAFDVQSPDVTIQGLAINSSGRSIIVGNVTNSNVHFRGNYVGADISGLVKKGILSDGVRIHNSSFVTVGTDGDGVADIAGSVGDVAERNLIAGTGFFGVYLSGSSSLPFDPNAARDNVVAGNWIGLDRSGTKAIGFSKFGVLMSYNANNNRIGTNGDGKSDAAEANVISGNRMGGIAISADAHHNEVFGNIIGAKPDLSGAPAGPEPHLDVGVGINFGAHSNVIGETGARANTIAFNRGPGVAVVDRSTNEFPLPGVNFIWDDNPSTLFGHGIAVDNAIRGNSIYFNGDSSGDNGIDLGGQVSTNGLASLSPNGFRTWTDGVTLNDADLLSPITGANRYQNYPEIETILIGTSSSNILVTGKLNSVAGETYRLDFYATPGGSSPFSVSYLPDDREGKHHLGFIDGTADSSGRIVFTDESFTIPLAGETIWSITATATRMISSQPVGDTSEFSLPYHLIYGTSGADQIEIQPGGVGGTVDIFVNGSPVTAADVFRPGNGLTIDLGDGADEYGFVDVASPQTNHAINFGQWTGKIYIDDTGASGTDTLLVYGTDEAEGITKISNGTIRTVDRTSPIAETIIADGIESATIDGRGGDDIITDPGENTTILGGPGNDTIIIDATFGTGVIVDGGEDEDTVILMLGNLAGPVTVKDSGTTGKTTVKVVGTAGDDQMTLTSTQVSSGSEVVNLDPGLDNAELILDGGEGQDTVTVESTPPGVTTTLESAVQTVQIDIKPGSTDNPLNLNSKGVIPVALFGTATFDVTQVVIASVRFAGAAVSHSTYSDINGDGHLDLVLHFRAQDTNLLQIYEQLLIEDWGEDGILNSTRQRAAIELTGQTSDGRLFGGSDEADLFLSGKKLRDLLDALFANGF